MAGHCEAHQICNFDITAMNTLLGVYQLRRLIHTNIINEKVTLSVCYLFTPQQIVIKFD